MKDFPTGDSSLCSLLFHLEFIGMNSELGYELYLKKEVKIFADLTV